MTVVDRGTIAVTVIIEYIRAPLGSGPCSSKGRGQPQSLIMKA